MLAGLAWSCSGLDDSGEVLARARNLVASYRDTVHDIVLDLEVEQGGRIWLARTMRRGDRFRMEMPLAPPRRNQAEPAPETLGIIVSDGRAVWLIAPVLGRKKLSGPDARLYRGQIFWWESEIAALDVRQLTEVDGRLCLELEVAGPNIHFTRLWVDRTNLVQVKAEGRGVGGGAATYEYGDFAQLAPGLLMPRLTRIVENGRPTIMVRIRTARVNTGLAPELFDPELVPDPGPSSEEFLQGLEGLFRP